MWATDVSQDVVNVQPDGSATLVNNPDYPPAYSDITLLKALHRRHTIKARLYMAGSPHGGYDIVKTYHFEMRTGGVRYHMRYEYGDLDRGSDYALHKRGSDGNFREVRCDGLELEVSRKKQLIRWSAPRTCIGRPKWVRMGADTYQSEYDTGEHYDNALSTGEEVDEWQRHITVGPRLRRP
jgi:hypothetical protein